MLLRILSRVLVVLLGAVLLAPSSGVALQSTPESAMGNPFADLGLSQIDITVTDSAFEGVPAELDAGRYVVALTNDIDDEFGQGGAFMQVPPGMTMDEFLAMAAPVEASPVAGDMATAEASPMAGGEDMGPPAWYYETVIAGGPYALSGQTAYAVVDLTAGEWVFWAEYPGAPQAPVPINVTGEVPADAPVPEAGITIEMSEFAFTFSSDLTAGTHVIELANVGEQPHFLGVGLLPDGTTLDDLTGLIESDMSVMMGTPVATPEDGLSFDDIEDVFGTGDQSAGVTAWYAVTLDPGIYGAVCFVTDPESGLPHAMLGMVDLFEIED